MAWAGLEGRTWVGQTFLFVVDRYSFGVDMSGSGIGPAISSGAERYSFEGGPSGFYHVCTDGASLEWLFRDDSDFIAGVNRAGICSVVSGVRLVTFVLMDNHVHFVVHGQMPSCKDFILRYKNLTGKYIYSRYGIKGHTHTLPAEIIRIDTPDRLLATLAYIDRNPIVAGWRMMPDEYRWGVSRLMFREQRGRESLRKLDTYEGAGCFVGDTRETSSGLESG